MQLKNKYLNNVFEKKDVILCHSLNIDRTIILNLIEDVIFSSKKKYIIDKSFFHNTFELDIFRIILNKLKYKDRSININEKFNKILKSSIIKYDFNSNFLEILFEALNNENSKFILIGCDMISWNSINIICDLAKKNNKKILILLEDVVPSNFDYSDYGERTTRKVKKIYANLEGRNKNLEIVSREVFINEKN